MINLTNSYTLLNSQTLLTPSTLLNLLLNTDWIKILDIVHQRNLPQETLTPQFA